MINIIQGFNVGSPLPIDGRIVLSRAEMLKCCDPNDPSFNTMPDRYFTICEEDRLFYLYSKEYDSEGNPVKASFDKAVPEKLSQLENDGNGDSEGSFATDGRVDSDVATLNARIDDVIISTSEGFISNEEFIDTLDDYGLIQVTSEGISFGTPIVNNIEIECKTEEEYGSEADYKLKLILKDYDGKKVAESNIIDLPIENVVMSVDYVEDSEGHWLVITLNNGNKTKIPVGDIIQGLVTNDVFNDHVDNIYLYESDTDESLHITHEKGKEWDDAVTALDELTDRFNDLTSEGISIDDLDENVTGLLNRAASAVLEGENTSKLHNDGESSESGIYVTEKYFNDNLFESSESYLQAGDNIVVEDELNGKKISARIHKYIAGQGIHFDPAPGSDYEIVEEIWADATAPTWQVIDGDPYDNQGLADVLNSKQDKLTAGDYIDISSEGVISGTGYDLASSEEDGLLSSTDFIKLQGIATGAEVNVQANWNEENSSSDAFIQNKPDIKSFGKVKVGQDVISATVNDDEIELVAGDYITLETSEGDIIVGASIGNATTEVAGLMSSSDKTKLDTIDTGAEVNVQPDWLQDSSEADDFIKNKPFTTLDTSVTESNNPVTASGIKTYVDSAIATSTATFRGTYESAADLPTHIESSEDELKNNDYAFVITVTSEGNSEYTRYKYNGSIWVEEYVINNSSFTADQWKAINSGIDQAKVEAIPTTASSSNKLITATELSTGLSTKQNTLVTGTNIRTVNNQNLLSVGGTYGTNLQVGTVTSIQVNGDGSWTTTNGAAAITTAGTVSVAHRTQSSLTPSTYGPASNQTVAFASSFTVPSFNVDAAGHMTSASNRTITLPTAAAGRGLSVYSGAMGVAYTTATLLSSGWTEVSGSEASAGRYGYYNTLVSPALAYLSENSHPVIDLNMAGVTEEHHTDIIESWNNIYRAIVEAPQDVGGVTNGVITFYAYPTQPDIDIDLNIKG